MANGGADELKVKNLEHVRVLSQDETVRLDSDRLQTLFEQLGEAGAEDVVCRAMEELAVRLATTERLYRQDKFGEMRKAARSLMGIADQIGMNSLSRVAGDVTNCVDAKDNVALSATMSRLLRIGDRSLSEIWGLDGIQV